MTQSNLIRPVSEAFISNHTTKRLASFVIEVYKQNYKGIHWSKCPVLETTCYNQAQDLLSVINIPSDAYKMNLGFLEAIKRMNFDFIQEFQVEEWEQQLLDLPFSYVDRMFSIDYLEQE